jgi:hypothetical protein
MWATTAVLTCLMFQSAVPSPVRPEWGPEPPVAPYGRSPLPRQTLRIPMIFPLIGTCRWGNDFGNSRGAFLHTGIDMKAPKMTPIVAPFRGVLGMKKMSFWIWGDNGCAVLGTHLNDDEPGTHNHKASRDFMFAPNLIPGQVVEEGQFIGYVGESGDATAPHLHFELYAPGNEPTVRRVRNPMPSLKMAQRIQTPRLQLQNPQERPNRGETRVEGCVRFVDSRRNLIQAILVARLAATGQVTVVTRPTFESFYIPGNVIQSVGGWATLSERGRYRPIGMIVGGLTANGTPIVRKLITQQ